MAMAIAEFASGPGTMTISMLVAAVNGMAMAIAEFASRPGTVTTIGACRHDRIGQEWVKRSVGQSSNAQCR